MAFASVPNGNNPKNEARVNEFLENKTKSIAKVYLYMGIGLAISAVVSILVGALFAGWFTNWGRVDYDYISDTAFFTYIGVMVASFLIMLVDSFIIARRAYSDTKSLWGPYILYTVVMGVFLSTFLIAGIDFYTLGEAFGISAIAFVVMGLIGYYSKANLNIVGMIASALLFMLILGSVFWVGLYLISPTAFYIYDVVVSIAVMVFLLIMIAVDTYNIKRILDRSSGKNIMLYCAFTMYSDFIMVFIRVLYILASLKKNN